MDSKRVDISKNALKPKLDLFLRCLSDNKELMPHWASGLLQLLPTDKIIVPEGKSDSKESKISQKESFAIEVEFY